MVINLYTVIWFQKMNNNTKSTIVHLNVTIFYTDN